MSSPTDIYCGLSPIREVKINSTDELEPYFKSKAPFVVRGLANDWPLVKAGKKSGKAARDYLESKAADRPFAVSMGSNEFDGRIFYRDDMSMNFQMGKAKLPVIFERINKVENEDTLPIIYLSAINIKNYFNGLHEDNHIKLGNRQPAESIWIGTKSRIAAHNDFPDNLAFVAAGRRRFTLFPPSEFANLYIGPMDNTPAGRAISMVDFSNPNFEKFPKFAKALDVGLVTELEPGDAIHIPTTWWHHVEGLEAFNILVNYWWRETPRYFGSPQNALNHAMMAIRDLPDNEKVHWRELFDHYVFKNDGSESNYIPERGRGILGPMSAQNASKIRSYLIKMLSHE